MKSLGFILSYLTSQPRRRRNLRVVIGLVVVLVVMVAVYTTVFHVLMGREHHHYSWTTGVYWTLTTMSTLGFGDITFQSDAGRAFSALVLLSGALFILVLLPFAFIQFVFTPRMESREAARAPRKLPVGTQGHIVLAALGPIEDALIRRAKRARRPYVVLVPSVEEALALNDRGYKVMVGELDDPETYRAAQVGDAALVASTLPDTTNANIAFTVREIDGEVPVVVTASSEPAAAVLRLAGASEVIELGRMLGKAMAQRVLGDADSHVVGAIDDLVIAEASVANTPLVGQTLGELAVRERCGVNVVGVLERGVFCPWDPDLPITSRSVLVMAGNAELFDRYDARYGSRSLVEAPVVIIGAGGVGTAAGQVLGSAGIAYTMIEREPESARPGHGVDG